MSKAEEYNSELFDDLLNEIDLKEAARIEKRMLLAQKISEALESKHLLKGEFAKIMGVQPSVITKWLSGTHNFTSDTLSDIEEVLDIDLLSVTCKAIKSNTFVYFIPVSSSHKQQMVITQSAIPSKNDNMVKNNPVNYSKS